MTNPSLEYMRRIRREEQDKLLDMRRERAAKALRSLDLHGGSHAMLAQIAYAVHPHVRAWDAESCDHLRNILIELIGGDHEAASGDQRHCACGTGGCDCGHESAALETERQEVVSNLRMWKPETSHDNDGMGEAHIRILHQMLNLGGAMMMDGADAAKAVRDHLIHLLDGDQSHDTSPMRQENETGITDELREYAGSFYLFRYKDVRDKLDAIADRIDEQFAEYQRVVEALALVHHGTLAAYKRLKEKLNE